MAELTKEGLRKLNLVAIQEEKWEDPDTNTCPRLTRLFEEALRKHTHEDEELHKLE